MQRFQTNLRFATCCLDVLRSYCDICICVC